jgi:hypothetical protein
MSGKLTIIVQQWVPCQRSPFPAHILDVLPSVAETHAAKRAALADRYEDRGAKASVGLLQPSRPRVVLGGGTQVESLHLGLWHALGEVLRDE